MRYSFILSVTILFILGWTCRFFLFKLRNIFPSFSFSFFLFPFCTFCFYFSLIVSLNVRIRLYSSLRLDNQCYLRYRRLKLNCLQYKCNRKIRFVYLQRPFMFFLKIPPPPKYIVVKFVLWIISLDINIVPTE